jgi:hypothetical protein
MHKITIYCVQKTKINSTKRMRLKQLKKFFLFKILLFVCKLLCQEKKFFLCVIKKKLRKSVLASLKKYFFKILSLFLSSIRFKFKQMNK